MAEMWTRAPIMQGSTEQQQIQYITQLCGSISPEVWPGVESMELYSKLDLPKNQKRKVSSRFTLRLFSRVVLIQCHEFREIGYELNSVLLFTNVSLVFDPKVRDRLKYYVKDSFACDLLDKLLALDPLKRIDADTALNHDFFWTDPMPMDLANMLQHHSQSMFEYLAPPRRAVAAAARPGGVGVQPKPSTEVGYRDRVF